MSIEIGAQAPDFTLSDTAGAAHSPGGGPVVVVFTCNHCPYALAWHERIADLARDYGGRGVRVLCINSNDAQRYPRDSPEAMRERVSASPGDWPMPYLHDPSQQVARDYDALTTPDVFVLDAERRLVYRGAPDDDYDDPQAGAVWLRAALEDLLAGRAAAEPLTEPVGCSIKWRS